MYAQHRTAARLPTLPDRSDLPAEEQEDFARVLQVVEKYSESDPVAQARPRVDGKTYGYDYWRAFANTPRLMLALTGASHAVLESQGKPGTYSGADHELINLVLGFDSGYWGYHAGHTPNALSCGVRVEALEALRDGREEGLTSDEKLQVEFIRAVCDGGMTDEIWVRQVERLGSVRGAIEFAFFTCMLWVHHRMMWAFGAAAIELEDWNQLIADYKRGADDPKAATQDYVWLIAEARAAGSAAEKPEITG